MHAQDGTARPRARASTALATIALFAAGAALAADYKQAPSLDAQVGREAVPPSRPASRKTLCRNLMTASASTAARCARRFLPRATSTTSPARSRTSCSCAGTRVVEGGAALAERSRRARTRRPTRSACARACNGATAHPLPPTTSCSGTKTSFRRRSCRRQESDLRRRGQARRGRRRSTTTEVELQVRSPLRPLPAAARLRPGPHPDHLPEALPQASSTRSTTRTAST